MLTIKILFTINSLKKLFRQNTIYNSFRLKKHLVLIRKKSCNWNIYIYIYGNFIDNKANYKILFTMYFP